MKYRIRNFTLIELIVAIAVFMLVTATAVMALYAGQNTWKKIRVHNKRLNEYIAIDRIADTVIRNIVPFKWRDDSLSNKMVFIGDTDFLLVPALRAGHENGAFIFVKLYHNPEDKTLIAEYRNAPLLPWLDGKDSTPDTRQYPRETEVVATEIESVKFTYVVINNDELEVQEDWDEDSTEYGDLPAAIQITITWTDGSTKSWLRRLTGRSCYGKYGN